MLERGLDGLGAAWILCCNSDFLHVDYLRLS
jgi:hypothetical protein